MRNAFINTLIQLAKSLLMSWINWLEKYENAYLAVALATVGLTPIVPAIMILVNTHDWIYNSVNPQGWLVPAPLMLGVTVLLFTAFLGFIFVFEYAASRYYKNWLGRTKS